MSSTADLYHFMGSDLVVSNTGDLATAVDAIETQQRILRRLLTPPGGYWFHPNYGAGLSQYVGKLADFSKIKALIKGQMMLESAVSRNPAPVITVGQSPADPTAITVSISYTDAPTGQAQVLSFSVSQ